MGWFQHNNVVQLHGEYDDCTGVYFKGRTFNHLIKRVHASDFHLIVNIYKFEKIGS